MMVHTALRPDASLPELLAARARGASDGRLVLDTAGGIAVGLAVVIWRPAGWLLLLSAALCFACFGAWGILDRELLDHADTATRARQVLRASRALAAGLGFAAALTLVVAAFARVLGTWIS